jgi:molecular chaperone DnaJ
MAAINEAYRVLGDPGRRALYDRQLTGAPAPASNGTTATAAAPTAAPAAIDAAPARMPWKLMAWMAALGAAVVLVGATFIEPAPEPAPDGLLRSGSCVAIEANNDAREVSCTGEGDLVVDQLVPIDASCPSGTAQYRDRLGLGLACVRVETPD